jgi:hypothetical protein
MPRNVKDISTISIGSGIRQRSKKEELALDHPGHFQEYAFNVTNAPFHWEVFDLFLDGHKNPSGDNGTVLILAPRNHAKTTVAEGFVTWKVGHNNKELCQFVCSKKELAVERLSRIGGCIRFNERYKNLFGNLYPEGDKDYVWRTDKFDVMQDRENVWDEGSEERDSSFTAFGIDSSVEGGRATIQVFDDVVSLENSQGESSRRHVNQKFWMSFDPMLVPLGQQIILGTRFHYADVYSELIPKFDTDRFYTSLYSPEDVESIEELIESNL